MNDESLIDLAMQDTREKMSRAVEHAKTEFGAVRTGRAAPVLVEKLRVDYFGTEVPLQQLAGITVPEARVLVVHPYDKGSMKAIEKAIQLSDLGVNPSNDGAVIRLVFPQLTEERRKDLVKVVRQRAEDARVAVRAVRRATRQDLEALERDSEISSDDLDWAEKDLEKLTHEFIADVDRLLSHKEQELLDV
ncbi:MAG: ribosome recycling factor [Acidimicrobiaceae bacterium]|jgi:ribosome recycling factor|nr:ribosome recycling factor [Acidimicrobiaceae bacterium]